MMQSVILYLNGWLPYLERQLNVDSPGTGKKVQTYLLMPCLSVYDIDTCEKEPLS